MSNEKADMPPRSSKERSFQHFRYIRIPFDDCRISGDEMPRLSGVKPWVARDLIAAVENQWQIYVADSVYELEDSDDSLIAYAFIRSNGVWYLVGTGDYRNRYDVHVIPVTQFKHIKTYKFRFSWRHDPSVLKDIMRERLNPPPKPAPAAPVRSQTSIFGVVVICTLILLFFVALCLSSTGRKSRRSRDDWDSKGRWVDVVAEKEYYRR